MPRASEASSGPNFQLVVKWYAFFAFMVACLHLVWVPRHPVLQALICYIKKKRTWKMCNSRRSGTAKAAEATAPSANWKIQVPEANKSRDQSFRGGGKDLAWWECVVLRLSSMLVQEYCHQRQREMEFHTHSTTLDCGREAFWGSIYYP